MLIGLLILCATSNAALVVNLVGGAGDDGGAYDDSTVQVSNSVVVASGSFSVSWTPSTVTDASLWSFDQIKAYEIRDYMGGWGLSTIDDSTAGYGQLQTGEAFC